MGLFGPSRTALEVTAAPNTLHAFNMKTWNIKIVNCSIVGIKFNFLIYY
jgi:hypothetical protein